MTHSSQRFCLRWNNHQSNLLSVFDQLLHDESFVDVTIAVEGQLLRAHKMVLSACSPYFQALFVSHPDKHPIVILKDVPFADMRSLLDFMYRGEVSVDQDRLTAFLKVAESLRIKGLTEVNEEKCDLPSIASSLLSNQQRSTPPPAAPPPPPSLHRIHLTQPSSSSSSSSSTTSSNAKRCASSPSNFNPYCGSNASTIYSQKRKRGRPRKLSGGSDTPSAASPEHETDPDLRNSQGFADSPYAHGPPDLLEVNMTEHSQNSPSSYSEDHNLGSPEANMAEDDDCCIKTEPNEESGSTAFQECKSPHLKDSPNSRSQSHTPTGQSERYPPDKCQWKEILKRLKKPEITIRVENNDKLASDESSCGVSISAVVNDRKSIAGSDSSSAKNNSAVMDGKSYSLDNFYNNSAEGSSSSASKNHHQHDIHSWYSESHQQTGYFMDADGEDVDEEDEAMLKYEYESSRLAALANNTSSPDTGSGSTLGTTSVTVSATPAASAASNEHAKPLDKSSVRRYCVQVAEHLFQCTLCYKTYTHISNFSRHFLSAHHGLRQEIPCPVCYRIFTRRDNMLTHMKQVHRITVTRGLATSIIQKLSAANEDLPMLRLVPKSELLAVYHKDGSGGSSLIKNESETSSNNTSGTSANNNSSSNVGSVNHRNTGSPAANNNNNSSNNTSINLNSNNNNNSKNTSSINSNNSSGGGANNNNSNFISNNNFLLNNSSSHFMLNNDMKFSPPPHLMSPQSNSSSASTPAGGDFSGTPPNKPAPTRRRVRRRATSSSDPAEQLTEMSVRGLNLFRYACIDEGVYKCLECAKTDIVKTFKNKYSFQRHAFLYHEGCQRKVFPCPVCGKEFSRPDKMKNHMKTVHDCFMPKEVMVPKDCIFPAAPTIPFFLSPP